MLIELYVLLNLINFTALSIKLDKILTVSFYFGSNSKIVAIILSLSIIKGPLKLFSAKELNFLYIIKSYSFWICKCDCMNIPWIY